MNPYFSDDYIAAEEAELRAEDRAARRLHNEHMRHPDWRDPDAPEVAEDEEGGEE